MTTITAHGADLRQRIERVSGQLTERQELRWAAAALAVVLGVLVLRSLASGWGSLIGLAAVAVAAAATGAFVLHEEEVEAESEEELEEVPLDHWFG